MRAEFLTEHDRRHATIADLQQALDAWVVALQHRAAAPGVGDAAPDRAVPACLATGGGDRSLEPAPVPASAERSVVQPPPAIVRLPGVQRWVDQHGLISLGGFRYRVPIVLAGEPVEAVAAEHLVRIFHREVLVAEHVQRRKPDTDLQQVRLRQGSRRPRRPTDGLAVTRVVDSSGYVSFAGTNYRVGNRWRGRSDQVCIVADSVQFSLRRPDRAGASDPARPGQRAWCVRHPERAAPPPTGCAGRCRRQGQAAARSAYRPSLDPDPLTRREIAAARNHPTRRTS